MCSLCLQRSYILILDEAVSGFEQCQAVPHLKQSLFLQVFKCNVYYTCTDPISVSIGDCS